jgi:hypothetical protein
VDFRQNAERDEIETELFDTRDFDLPPTITGRKSKIVFPNGATR